LLFALRAQCLCDFRSVTAMCVCVWEREREKERKRVRGWRESYKTKNERAENNSSAFLRFYVFDHKTIFFTNTMYIKCKKYKAQLVNLILNLFACFQPKKIFP
jgi:hypothetical protein